MSSALRRFSSATAVVVCTLVLLVAWRAATQAPFTLVLIPDTQNFNEKGGKFVVDDTYRRVTNYIASLPGSKVALHLGDITDANGKANADGDGMWVEASAAHRTLDDAGIPYLVAPGNHDHAQVDDDSHRLIREADFFNWNFPRARFAGRPWYLGGPPSESRTAQNSALQFSVAGTDFIAIALDHSPTKDAVCWANDLARNNPTKRIIVTTHCYQRMGDDPSQATATRDWAPCASSYRMVGMDGKHLWDELLDLHSNIWMVASGHWQGGAYAVTTPNSANARVHEVLVDYQDERLAPNDAYPPASSARKHGNGWIKLLEYDASLPGFRARPYSVLGAQTFNIGRYDSRTRSDDSDDVCNERQPCYDQAMSHWHHSFDLELFTLPADAHRSPSRFTDRYVNATSAGDQRQPDLSMLPGGEVFVVWADDSDAPAGQFEVFARRLEATGCAPTGDVRVNLNSWRQQRRPAVATDDAGNAVVAWEDDSHGAEGVYQIYARGLAADGAQRFYPITVNSGAAGQQLRPAVAMSPGGGFAVAWEDTRSGASDVYARLFDGNGLPRTGDIRVAGAQSEHAPAIVTTASGQYLVAWRTPSSVLARTLGPTGTPIGSAVTIGSGLTVGSLSLTADADGAVVAWTQDGRRVNVRRLRVDASGVSVLGPTFTAHLAPAPTAQAPRVERVSVAAVVGGRAMVVWQDDSDGNGSTQISARRLQWNGATWGAWTNEAVWTVNKDCHDQQLEPRIAMRLVAGDPRWVVAWTDDLDGNQRTQILARGGRFHDTTAAQEATCG